MLLVAGVGMAWGPWEEILQEAARLQFQEDTSTEGDFALVLARSWLRVSLAEVKPNSPGFWLTVQSSGEAAVPWDSLWVYASVVALRVSD